MVQSWVTAMSKLGFFYQLRLILNEMCKILCYGTGNAKKEKRKKETVLVDHEGTKI